MSDLPWYRRLHWRVFVTLVVLLVLCSIPAWFIVLSSTAQGALPATQRAIAIISVAALAASALTAVVVRQYIRVRLEELRSDFDAAVEGTEMIRVHDRDEFYFLSDRCVTHIRQFRDDIERLELEKGRLSALLSGMSEAVIMVDDHERVLLANPVARGLLELAPDYAGQRLAEICDVEELVDFTANVLWSGTASTAELRFPVEDDVRHMSVSAAPITGDGGQQGAVVVLYDVTRLRRLERVRRDFVANVSHELRTPIASIKSSAETLMLPELDIDPTAREFVETISRNAERMATIVDDLLVLSRLEAAGEDVGVRPVDLAAVFAEVVDRSDPLAREADLEFQVELEEGLPEIIGEPHALAQVLQNLVENAIKYTPEGGDVELRAFREGAEVCIEVSDTGVGIPEEHLPRIFERFYRVDEGRSREVGGTGLGLAIVKHLVRKLGGSIAVRSEVGETTFTLRFPFSASDDDVNERNEEVERGVEDGPPEEARP